MARIDERIFKQYIDGRDRMTAAEYMRDREVLRLAINETEDKLERMGIDRISEISADLSGINQRIDTELVQTQAQVQDLTQRLDTANLDISNANAQLATIQQNQILNRLSIVNGVLFLDGQPLAAPSAPGNGGGGSNPPPVEITNSFGLVGKWFEETVDGQKVFSSHYPGATIVANVTGTSRVVANFRYSGMGWTEAPVLAIRINGGQWNRKVMGDSVEVVNGLNPSSSYRVEIVFDGWDQNDPLWNNQRKFSIKNIALDETGQLTYVNSKRNILFVGDSITAGTKSVANSTAAAASSAVLSYSQILGDLLNVNVYRSAFPGTKVIDTFTRDNVKVVSNGKAVPDYNIHTVVVCMGTNDYGQPSDTFLSNYQLLINSIREKYPTQCIYILGLVERFMDARRNTELAQIAANNENVTHVDTQELLNVAYTDDLHPSAAGAHSIATYVQAKMVADNWEGGGGYTPAPPEENPTPTVPEGNLWTLGGMQSSYNPLPMAFNSVAIPGSWAGSSLRLSFKARSTNGSSIATYAEWQRDFERTVIPLTSNLTEFSYVFPVTWTQDGNFLFICPANFETDTGIIIQDIVLQKAESSPITPDPTPDPDPGDPTPVPTGNLWTAGGNPAAYNPLPMAWNACDLPGSLAGKTLRLSFKAKTNNSSKLATYTEFQQDFSRREIALTTELVEHTFTFTVTWNQPNNKLFLLPADFSKDNGIIIQDILLQVTNP